MKVNLRTFELNQEEYDSLDVEEQKDWLFKVIGEFVSKEKIITDRENIQEFRKHVSDLAKAKLCVGAGTGVLILGLIGYAKCYIREKLIEKSI